MKLLNHIKGKFTQVPNDIITDIRISSNARFLFVYLAMRPTGWQFNNTEIIKILGCSRNSLNKYFKELLDFGWLTKSQVKLPGGKFGFNQIELHSESSVAQKTDIGLPLHKKTVAQKNRSTNIVQHSNTDINSNTNKENNRVKSEIDYTQEIEILKTVSKLFEKKYYDTKAKQTKWLEEIRKLITIDKEKPEDIIAVIQFAKEDDFWCKNLLSITALRKKNTSGISKYDNIKAKMPNQAKQSHIEYKNGAKAAKVEDIRSMLGDEYIYQKNVIEGKSEYVEYDELIYIVRSDEKGKFIISHKGKIYV